MSGAENFDQSSDLQDMTTYIVKSICLLCSLQIFFYSMIHKIFMLSSQGMAVWACLYLRDLTAEEQCSNQFL